MGTLDGSRIGNCLLCELKLEALASRESSRNPGKLSVQMPNGCRHGRRQSAVSRFSPIACGFPAKHSKNWRVGNLRPTFESILWFFKPYRIGTTISDNVLAHSTEGFNEAAFVNCERTSG